MTEPPLTTTEIQQLLDDLSLDPVLRHRLEQALELSLRADGISNGAVPKDAPEANLDATKATVGENYESSH